jgi:hypothetical protein
VVGAGLVLATPAVQSRAADIVGRTADAQGRRVSSVEISVQDLHGKRFASVKSDASGNYEIHGLSPGVYALVVRGQSAVTYVGDEGVTVNWGVEPGLPPVAIARRGTIAPVLGLDRPISPMSVEPK